MAFHVLSFLSVLKARTGCISISIHDVSLDPAQFIYILQCCSIPMLIKTKQKAKLWDI